MYEVTHETRSTGDYALWCNDFEIGRVRKNQDSFTADLVDGEKLEAKTMAGLKEAVALHVADWERLSSPNRERFTVQDAIKLAGLSHSAVRVGLEEAHRFHRYLGKHELGGFLIRQTMELQAAWPWGTTARRWLQNNAHLLPKVRKVDFEASERTGRAVYLD